MTQKLLALTEQLWQELKADMAWLRNQVNNTRQRSAVPPANDPAPETYVAFAPHGIPAAAHFGTGTGTGTLFNPAEYQAGTASCQVWQIQQAGTRWQFLPVGDRANPLPVTVYNVSQSSVSKGMLPVTRDKFGRWLAVTRGAGSTVSGTQKRCINTCFNPLTGAALLNQQRWCATDTLTNGFITRQGAFALTEDFPCVPCKCDTNNSCCPNPIPTQLCATITGSQYSCLVGQHFELDYTGTPFTSPFTGDLIPGYWVGTFNVSGCGEPNPNSAWAALSSEPPANLWIWCDPNGKWYWRACCGKSGTPAASAGDDCFVDGTTNNVWTPTCLPFGGTINYTPISGGGVCWGFGDISFQIVSGPCVCCSCCSICSAPQYYCVTFPGLVNPGPSDPTYGLYQCLAAGVTVKAFGQGQNCIFFAAGQNSGACNTQAMELDISNHVGCSPVFGLSSNDPSAEFSYSGPVTDTCKPFTLPIVAQGSQYPWLSPTCVVTPGSCGGGTGTGTGRTGTGGGCTLTNFSCVCPVMPCNIAVTFGGALAAMGTVRMTFDSGLGYWAGTGNGTCGITDLRFVCGAGQHFLYGQGTATFLGDPTSVVCSPLEIDFASTFSNGPCVGQSWVASLTAA